MVSQAVPPGKEKSVSQPSVTEKRESGSLFVMGDWSGVSAGPQTAPGSGRGHTTAVTQAPRSSAVSGSRSRSERALNVRGSSTPGNGGIKVGERPSFGYLAVTVGPEQGMLVKPLACSRC